MDDVAKRVRENGGCDDWPCDYACLRRGACDHEGKPKKTTKPKKDVDISESLCKYRHINTTSPLTGAFMRTTMQKVIKALEAIHPGYKVVDHTIPAGLTNETYDALMVAIVNAGPPITDPALLTL